MSKEDVFNQIKSIKGSIAYMSRHSPHKLAKEDMEFMEEPLAKLEIAIRKIKNIPECFNLTENELQTVHEEYKKLRQEIEKIDLQRISWN
ncbi:hypothetical protein [Priestia filamentosa]|uniref:hypothetical protein n=1 Tax=Priestia filamentosa TaxID=1402861 RepID=UPI002E1AF84E|nr:hypothetical protein [Priestia filamentosa]